MLPGSGPVSAQPPGRVSLPDRLAGIQLPEGIPLLIVHGSAPFATDLYLGHDLRVRELERALWAWLRAEGFQRIVVNRPSRPAFVLDAESERLLRPPERPTVAAAAAPSQMRHFSGPLGRAVLPVARTIQQREPAHAVPGWSAEPPPGLPGLAPAPSSSPPGFAPPSGFASSLTDYGAVDLMDAAMRDKRARTALIFAEAEQWLRHNQAASRFADALTSWLESPGVAGNVCVLVFRQETLAGVRQFVDTEAAYPVLGAVLSSLERGDRGMPGTFAIGPPGLRELSGILHLHRLTRDLTLGDWRELPALVRAMAASRVSVRAWQDRLDMLAGEDTALSLGQLRRRRWVPDSVTGSLSAMDRLRQMTGLKEVKQHIEGVGAYVRMQAQLHAAGRLNDPPASRLNLVFTGNPGTGKSTVAELLGEIYRDLGALPVGHVHSTTPKEMIAGYVGQTRAAIENAVAKARGGVLFLDEAYQLSDQRDGFGSEAITTLVQLMDRERGQLAVVVAGYPEKMKEFLRANPGLPRRFPEHNRIHFADYSPDELMQILLAKLRGRGLSWTPELESRLREVVTAMADGHGPEFGNAGDMENLAEALQVQWSVRVAEPSEPAGTPDIPAFYRGYLLPGEVVPLADVTSELQEFVGMAAVKSVLSGLADNLALELRRREAGLGTGAVVAPHMLFTGPPGTGKTSVARLAGRMFRAMGLLRSGHVIEATRSDLVAEYIGQTGPRTRAMAMSALDGVLFIDEAYSLGDGAATWGFGSEAITELMKQMTDHPGRLVVIAAGYPAEMTRFLRENPGLRSRFTERVEFPGYSDAELVEILHRAVAREDYLLPDAVAARASQWLAAERAASGADFGNARAVGVLLAAMKRRLSRRVTQSASSSLDMLRTFEPEDVPDAAF